MPLYADLDEDEANEIAAILMELGVDCLKQPGEEGKWNLQIAKEDFSYAIQILDAKELPREKFQTMSEVFPKGTFSSPNEDHYRMVDLKAQQLAEGILKNFPAVMTASVQLAIPLADPLDDEEPEAKASVMIKYRPDYDFEMEAKEGLRETIANSVNGLTSENVAISANTAEEQMPPPRPVPEGDLQSRIEAIPPLTLAGASAGIGAILAGIIVLILRRGTDDG